MSHLLMVYGTLKRGFYNNPVFPKQSEYIGEVKSHPGYTMINLDRYPGVIEKGTGVIYGELWLVPNFIQLDILEENGKFYTRVQRKFIDDKDQEISAWIYVLPSNFQFLSSNIIKNGRWVR